jgi:hypothetical protein
MSDERPEAVKILPMSTVPKDGRYIQLWIKSGYVCTPMRCTVARYEEDIPRSPWRDYAGDSVFDAGGEEKDLIGWLPLPEAPLLTDRDRDPAFNFGQWKCDCGYSNHAIRVVCRNCASPKK